MTVKNKRIGDEDWRHGEIVYDYKLNDTFSGFVDFMSETLQISALNKIRQLLNRNVPLSSIEGWFGDVYTNETGRKSNVSTGSTTAVFDTSYYKAVTGSSNIIVHNIPSGTFNSNISNSIGVPFISQWEEGNKVEFKLKNSNGDDSGWLSTGKQTRFPHFDYEPEYLNVKLIQNEENPTDGYPAIKGFLIHSQSLADGFITNNIAGWPTSWATWGTL